MMKFKLLCFFSIGLLSLNLSGQTFSESYYDLFRKYWEEEPSEERKAQVDPGIDSLYRKIMGKGFWEIQAEQMKESTLTNLENYKSVFELKGMDIDKESNFIIIEESSTGGGWPRDQGKNGLVVVNEQIFSYRFDPNKEVQYTLVSDFLDSNQTNFDCRRVITDLVKLSNIDSLSALAKWETQRGVAEPKVQYEIVVYNKSEDKPIRLFYLHELIREFIKEE